MNSFKPGDWVVNTTTDDYYDGIRNWFQLKETDLIFKQGVNATEWEANFKFINSHKIWQPKPDEWCWFLNYKNDIPRLRKFISASNPFDRPTVYTTHPDPATKMSRAYCGIESYNYCEPFIGQLPTILKDNK